jgi:hypothetical protein
MNIDIKLEKIDPEIDPAQKTLYRCRDTCSGIGNLWLGSLYRQ